MFLYCFDVLISKINLYIYYFDTFSIKKILIKNHYHNIKHTQNRLIVS
jgi:hypothetical protein